MIREIFRSNLLIFALLIALTSCAQPSEDVEEPFSQPSDGYIMKHEQPYPSLENEAKWLAHIDVEDSIPVKTFFSEMREAGKLGNESALADLVCFPFSKMKDGNLRKLYENKTEFLNDFEKIVSSSARKALMNADYTDFWANSDGGMISSGAIWFNQCDGQLKIIRING